MRWQQFCCKAEHHSRHANHEKTCCSQCCTLGCLPRIPGDSLELRRRMCLHIDCWLARLSVLRVDRAPRASWCAITRLKSRSRQFWDGRQGSGLRYAKNVKDTMSGARGWPEIRVSGRRLRAACIHPVSAGSFISAKCCKSWQLALIQVRQEGCLRLDLMAGLKGNAEKLIGSECVGAVGALKGLGCGDKLAENSPSKIVL